MTTLGDYAAFDTTVPLLQYEKSFGDYIERLQTEIIDYLNEMFNFHRDPMAVDYNDFWGVLNSPNNIKRISLTDQFDQIKTMTQEVNNMIGQRYLDYVGMITAMDPYMCFAADAFSRITDTAWAFGDGQVYTIKYGKTLSDGTEEVLRNSLEYYRNIVEDIFREFNEYITTDHADQLPSNTFGMDRSKVSNVEYLNWKKNYYFLPKIRQIESAIIEAQEELYKLLNLASNLKDAITIWFPESFKLVSYTSLVFNLNKKNEHLANKIVGYSNGMASMIPARNIVTKTSIIAVNEAKFWKARVLPDLSNLNQCLTEAIISGFAILTYPGMLEMFINESWDFIIPRYS